MESVSNLLTSHISGEGGKRAAHLFSVKGQLPQSGFSVLGPPLLLQRGELHLHPGSAGLGYEVATSIMPLIQRRPRRNTDTFEIPEHAPFMSHGRLLPGQPSAKSSFKCEEQTSTVHQCATKFEFPRAVYVRPPVPSACSCEGTSPLNCWIPSSRVQHLQRIGKRLWPWKGRC